MFIKKDDIKKLHRNCRKENYFKKHFSETLCEINKQYKQNICFAEKLYLYVNNILEKKRCPVCNKYTKFVDFNRGYNLHCSSKCAGSNDATKVKRLNTNKQKLGVDNPFESEKIKEKIKTTNKKRYGVEYSHQSPDIIQKTKDTCMIRYGGVAPACNERIINKIKSTKKSLYGDENFTNRNKSKLTCLKKYGCDNFSKTAEFKIFSSKNMLSTEVQSKRYKKQKENNSFNSSTIEKHFQNYLNENNINYIRQYKSDKYPFCCDFYFPDKDLYFEINGHWTHGGHPFDCNNKDDLLRVEKWQSKRTKFYDNAIKTWTIKDREKRKIGKQLNWFETFSIDINEIIKQIKNKI